MSNTITAQTTPVNPPAVPTKTEPTTPVAHADAKPNLEVTTPTKLQQSAPKLPKLNVDLKDLQKNLEEAIHMLNEQMKSNGRNLNFSLDQELNRSVITVKNTHTGEVVRQIPDETALRVAHNIERLKGILLDEII
jgi:flagellar protein FlaG